MAAGQVTEASTTDKSDKMSVGQVKEASTTDILSDKMSAIIIKLKDNKNRALMMNNEKKAEERKAKEAKRKRKSCGKKGDDIVT